MVRCRSIMCVCVCSWFVEMLSGCVCLQSPFIKCLLRMCIIYMYLRIEISISLHTHTHTHTHLTPHPRTHLTPPRTNGRTHTHTHTITPLHAHTHTECHLQLPEHAGGAHPPRMHMHLLQVNVPQDPRQLQNGVRYNMCNSLVLFT